MKLTYKIQLFLLHIGILIYSQFLSDTELFHASYILYIVQYFGFLLAIYLDNKRLPLVLMLSPSFLALLYYELNFITGSFYIPNHEGYSTLHYYQWISHFLNFRIITLFFLLSNYLVMLVFIRSTKIYDNKSKNKHKSIKKPPFKKTVVLVFSISVLAISLLYDKSLSFGMNMADYDFAYPFQLCASIPIIYLLVSERIYRRFFYYIALLTFFILVSWDSKREIFFVLLLILFFESLYGDIKLKLNIRSISIYLSSIFIFVLIVLWSSVIRGYGNYSDTTLIGSLKNVYTYTQEDYFSETVLGNFELLNGYGDSSNAIEGILKGDLDVLYGMTLVKVLFAPIPRSIFPEKPKSMIDIYTTKYYPEFRAIGGSMPIIIYSELFCNFHILSLIAIYLMFLFVDSLYLKLVIYVKNGRFNMKVISLLFLWASFILILRGDGLDVYIINWLLTAPIIFLFAKLMKKLPH